MPDAPPPVLEVEGLSKHFPVRKGILRRTVGHVHAVDEVSFAIGTGETLGLVGESGCGKTTVGRTILRLIEPTAGAIRLDGHDVTIAEACNGLRMVFALVMMPNVVGLW